LRVGSPEKEGSIRGPGEHKDEIRHEPREVHISFHLISITPLRLCPFNHQFATVLMLQSIMDELAHRCWRNMACTVAACWSVFCR
jgi:hypothetical protein